MKKTEENKIIVQIEENDDEYGFNVDRGEDFFEEKETLSLEEKYRECGVKREDFA